MFTEMQVFSLASAAYLGNGHTEYRGKESYAGRYIVGGIDTVVIPADSTASGILNGSFDISLSPRIHLAETMGVWLSGGSIYFDLGDTYYTVEAALTVAKMRGEFAIWDRLTNSEIEV